MKIASRSIWLTRSCALAAMVLASAVNLGCDQRLPADPALQIAEIRERQKVASNSRNEGGWLVHAATNHSPEARALMLEYLDHYHSQESGAAAILMRNYWIHDPEMRRGIVKWYLDPTRSQHNRQNAYNLSFRNFVDQYPELAELPSAPPVLDGVVHIQRNHPSAP